MHSILLHIYHIRGVIFSKIIRLISEFEGNSLLLASHFHIIKRTAIHSFFGENVPLQHPGGAYIQILSFVAPVLGIINLDEAKINKCF
jgi:hypothetical protein